jgi:hypothetical protein
MKQLRREYFWLKNLGLYLRNRKLLQLPESQIQGIADTSLTDSSSYAPYIQLCSEAGEVEAIFANFRRYKAMVGVLDHVSLSQGCDYLNEVKLRGNWDKKLQNTIQRLDSVGNPRQYQFSRNFIASPTLLRYAKVYSDLICLFGSLEKLKIAEIGVGFGGQSALITILSTPEKYFLYDLEEVLSLVRRFHRELALEDQFYGLDGRNPNNENVDLVISNYAFSELNRDTQEKYLSNVILGAKCGYITWNPLSWKNLDGLSVGDLLRRIPNSDVLPEVPLTFQGNLIIVWGHK